MSQEKVKEAKYCTGGVYGGMPRSDSPKRDPLLSPEPALEGHIVQREKMSAEVTPRGSADEKADAERLLSLHKTYDGGSSVMEGSTKAPRFARRAVASCGIDGNQGCGGLADRRGNGAREVDWGATGVTVTMHDKNGVSYRIFSPSGISVSSRSRRCSSEMDHACLYVSDLGFSLAAAGLRRRVFVGPGMPVRLKSEDLGLCRGRWWTVWRSTGTCGTRGRQVHWVRCRRHQGTRGDATGPPSAVAATSTSALLSPMSRWMCTPLCGGSAHPCAKVYAAQLLPFTCEAGANCSLSDESDESSNETALPFVRAAGLTTVQFSVSLMVAIAYNALHGDQRQRAQWARVRLRCKLRKLAQHVPVNLIVVLPKVFLSPCELQLAQRDLDEICGVSSEGNAKGNSTTTVGA
ncbi:hypothetical protein EDB83DRAFT_2558198 [Lactarius deliciosus]|nr:hypothetical protein EDB83DRAFT_2558198 [Lactarius deliciosus]